MSKTLKTSPTPEAMRAREREFIRSLDALLREAYGGDYDREEQLQLLANICRQMRQEATGAAVMVAESVAQTLYDASRELRTVRQLEPIANRISVMGNMVLDKAYQFHGVTIDATGVHAASEDESES